MEKQTNSKKMWSGRFEKQTDKMVDDFNASLPFDIKLYKCDIDGSIAHSQMLSSCGIISAEDMNLIHSGLRAIQADIESGALTPSGEDVHMFVEGELIKRIGDSGKRLHTARSRNDQVATDFRMYIRCSITATIGYLKELITTILKTSEENLDTIVSGYTHLQKAQPITLAHHIMAYAEMFLRDIDRLKDCYKRVNILPLGSGALASTTYNIDRFMVAKLLGFDDVTRNSIDGVSDRDFAVEYTFCLSTIAMHLSRFSEEIIIWNTDEFSYINLDDAFATGSSIMPQKKNPDIPELIRGKTGRVYGSLVQLLTMLKGIPLAYNKDMQEDKESVFDAEETVQKSIQIFGKMLRTSTFNREKMRKGADSGFTNATDVADYLVKKGMPFRDAHEVVGKMVLACIKNKTAIHELTLNDFKTYSQVFEEDILDAVKTENVVSRRNIVGGPNSEVVKTRINDVYKILQKI